MPRAGLVSNRTNPTLDPRPRTSIENETAAPSVGSPSFGRPEQSNQNVTTQVVWLAHARRRDFAKLDGSRVSASIMFQRCFLAVERKERMSAKSIAPCNDRKPPEIF